jgi:type VI secretion system protein ImpH
MGAQGRREDTSVSDRLLREPWRFGFYQATRLLEWIALRDRISADVRARGLSPDASVGEDVPSWHEAVRFRATPSARFPADEVLAIESGKELSSGRRSLGGPSNPLRHATARLSTLADDRTPYQMTVGFFGLTGPRGVLPPYYHRLLRRRLRARDPVLRDFLDIFNHRALSLFYRAWLKYRFPVAYERGHRGLPGLIRRTRRRSRLISKRFGHEMVAQFVERWRSKRFRIGFTAARSWTREDAFSSSLLALVGLGTAGQRGRYEHLEPAMLDFAGLVAHLPRTAIGLERILTEHFQLPVRVLQFQGQWLGLEPADRTYLGGAAQAGTANNRLGGSAVLGEGVWDVQSRFRVRIGPLWNPAEFYRFLPVAVGDDLLVLRQLVRVYAGPELEFDVQLVLPRTTWLRVELGGDQEGCALLGWNIWLQTLQVELGGEAERRPLLGENVWVRSGPPDTENGDVVFSDQVIGGPLY